MNPTLLAVRKLALRSGWNLVPHRKKFLLKHLGLGVFLLDLDTHKTGFDANQAQGFDLGEVAAYLRGRGAL